MTKFSDADLYIEKNSKEVPGLSEGSDFYPPWEEAEPDKKSNDLFEEKNDEPTTRNE